MNIFEGIAYIIGWYSNHPSALNFLTVVGAIVLIGGFLAWVCEKWNEAVLDAEEAEHGRD